jgi:hypothetical protein
MSWYLPSTLLFSPHSLTISIPGRGTRLKYAVRETRSYAFLREWWLPLPECDLLFVEGRYDELRWPGADIYWWLKPLGRSMGLSW